MIPARMKTELKKSKIFDKHMKFKMGRSPLNSNMREVKIGAPSESDEMYLVQTENAHLKETIIALREELQKLDA